MLRTCFSTACSVTTRRVGDALVGASFGHQLEHFALAGGEFVERVIRAVADEQRDDGGVERGAAACDASHAGGEFGDV